MFIFQLKKKKFCILHATTFFEQKPFARSLKNRVHACEMGFTGCDIA